MKKNISYIKYKSILKIEMLWTVDIGQLLSEVMDYSTLPYC